MRSLVIVIITSVFLVGCQEASFYLSTESRLPKWFDLPEDTNRADITLQMTTYIVPSEKTIFTLKGKGGRTISEITAHRKGGYLYPKKLASSPDGYPSFEVLIYDGVTDIIEHKKMEPIFYLTSDKDIWRELYQ